MGLFKDAFGAIKEWKDGESDKEFYEKQGAEAQKDHWDRINAQNFEYAKPSDAAPQYKATVSPVARAYLESFLTGNNPDAIQGTRAGSSGMFGTKAVAQNNFDHAYGGWDKLREQGRAELTDPNRFAVKPIGSAESRVTKDQQEAQLSSKNPQNAPLEKALGRKLSADEVDYLNKVWKADQGLGGKTGSEFIPSGNMRAYLISRLEKQQLEKLLQDRPTDASISTIEGYW